MTSSKLKFLTKYLRSIGLKKEAASINKMVCMASIDSPIEEIDVESMSDLLSEVSASDGEFIYLDNPSGSTKSFGGVDRELPFDYGEFPRLINPADNMGWDVIVVPSSNISISNEDYGYIDSGHNLIPIGYVPVNDSESDWMTNASKKPPIGNDKIILAPSGEYTDSDIEIIENFFSELWQFKSIRLFK